MALDLSGNVSIGTMSVGAVQGGIPKGEVAATVALLSDTFTQRGISGPQVEQGASVDALVHTDANRMSSPSFPRSPNADRGLS